MIREILILVSFSVAVKPSAYVNSVSYKVFRSNSRGLSGAEFQT